MEYPHLLLFGGVAVAVWFLGVYYWPLLILRIYKRAILVKGFGEGPVPVNTLYAEPQEFFAEPIASRSAPGSKLKTTGVNHDTLLTVGWLDLRKGPQILHVPDMAGRYYSVQFNDPSRNANFAYVGKRTTGTDDGDYLIVGPAGRVPYRKECRGFLRRTIRCSSSVACSSRATTIFPRHTRLQSRFRYSQPGFRNLASSAFDVTRPKCW
jgi:hypothetical protein